MGVSDVHRCVGTLQSVNFMCAESLLIFEWDFELANQSLGRIIKLNCPKRGVEQGRAEATARRRRDERSPIFTPPDFQSQSIPFHLTARRISRRWSQAGAAPEQSFGRVVGSKLYRIPQFAPERQKAPTPVA